jgi:nucleoside-diphosphate-sugar epimerase
MNGFSLPPEDLEHVLDHTRDLWDSLRGERLFITGGTGFFGMWLLESFLWANERLNLNAEAMALSRNPESAVRRAPHFADRPGLSYCQGDVRNFAFPSGKFSFMIHAATEASAAVNQGNPRLMFDTIVDGARRTLDFSQQCGVRRYLLASSGGLYGRQPPEIANVGEDYAGASDPFAPDAAYGVGKRAAELLCAIEHRSFGLETIIARVFALVGPYLPLDIHFALGNFLRDALSGGPIRVLGDGRPYRSYLYAADLAIWLWTLLFRGEPCRPYNVGSDRGISILEAARAVAPLSTGSSEVTVAKKGDLSVPAPRYVPSVDRARRELGLDVWIPFADAVQRTFAWYQQHSDKIDSQQLLRSAKI